MNVQDKIYSFIQEMDYLNNPHVLGVLFYGSNLTGYANKYSDIDLHIVMDNINAGQIIRGNKIIEGTRIEYFEKSLIDIYNEVEEKYNNFNMAPLTIFGTSKIIFARNNEIEKLQNYVKEKYQNGLPKLSLDAAKENVSIINNRMERLKKLADTDSPYFEHLYQLTVEKIRRFYHELKGYSNIETYKCYKLYQDDKYRETFKIDKAPDSIFVNKYFKAITLDNVSSKEKYALLEELYNYVIDGINLSNEEYRIPIVSRNIKYPIPNFETFENHIKVDSILVPSKALKKILMFIKKMDYLNNPHCLGVFVYGSSLTGFNNKDSDIDLHVIFDNKNPMHLIRGMKTIDETKIEYFEKPIQDLYLSIANGYLNQDNAFYSIIGRGTIVFSKDNRLEQLKQYAVDRFSTKMPCLSKERISEQISSLNNKFEKLEILKEFNSPLFDNYYHIVLEKIRKLYHKMHGISKIQTSKVYRIYTDDEYRESMYKEKPDSDFIKAYLFLMNYKSKDKGDMLTKLTTFYNYVIKNYQLGDEYRIELPTIDNLTKSNYSKKLLEKK